HALGGTDNAGSHPRRFLVARRVELHEHAHDQTVLARLQRTHAIRKRFGQHGHGAVGEINRGAAQARFPVENRAGANIMRDVRDVHLKMPAVCSAFDVDGVIEIARGFPVNRYNRQMAKIFAVRAFGLADGFGAKLRFLHDFVREQMRQVMLAYDDFGIYTEFARSTENFDDTAARRGAAAGKTRQLDVDHRAVEFRHARNAAAAEAALIEAARTHFLRKVRRQFVPRRNDDFVLDAGVVGENHVSLRAVTKQTHDRGVRAVQDANDAALATLGAWDTAPPLDLHQNVVSVHDVFDGIAGDVYVAIQPWQGRILHHEAVAVRVKDQTPREFVTTDGTKGGVRAFLSRRVLGPLLGVRDRVRLPPGKAVASPGQSFNSLTVLELREQLEQWPGVWILEAQSLGNLAGRGRLVPKL